jgi:N-acetylmuramic acid 6-phosphate etherase
MSDDRLDELVTEARSAGAEYEARSTLELVRLMNDADATVASAVGAAAAAIARVVDQVVERVGAGGRLVYAGAGTSGRLAALDAVECAATFSSDRVLALLAGAGLPDPLAQEAAEDAADEGARDARDAGISAADILVGVSASGRTPYVLGAVGAAAASGARTGCIVCTSGSELAREVDDAIEVVVGPEFVAGSTRLKAGTAQKLVLNTISTVAMIKLGKTYNDLMVDVAPTNEKLRARARRAVLQATGAAPEAVDAAFAAAEQNPKVAILSLLAGIDAETARTRLDHARGNIRVALGE